MTQEKVSLKPKPQRKNHCGKCVFLTSFLKVVGVRDNIVLEGTSQKAVKILITLSDFINLSGNNFQKYFCSLKWSSYIKL